MREDMPVVVVHMRQENPGDYKEVDRLPMELSRNAGGIPLASTRYAVTGLAYHHPELFHTKSVVALHVLLDPPELHIYLDGPGHPKINES